MTFAKTAVSTITAMSAADSAPSGLRRMVVHNACSRLTGSLLSSICGTGAAAMTLMRPLSSVADSRIEPGVREIDDQVQGHQRGRDEHHVGLHDRVVAVQDRLHGE